MTVLFFTITPSYAPQLALVLESILRHAPEGHLTALVLGSPGTEAAIARLDIQKLWEAQGHRLIVHDFDVCGRLNFAWNDSWIHPTVFSRLFFAEFLPEETNRVLYLDVDILIRGDITPLLEEDLNGAVVAAVEDHGISRNPRFFPTFETHHQQLGILHEPGRYFNAGVLLIDVAQWQAEQISERTLAFCASRHAVLPYADQDALNAVLKDRWKNLHPRWNCQRNLLEDFYASKGRSRFNARNKHPLDFDPVILHFTTHKKPWLAQAWHPRDPLVAWMTEYADLWLTHYAAASDLTRSRLRFCRFAHGSWLRYKAVSILGRVSRDAAFAR